MKKQETYDLLTNVAIAAAFLFVLALTLPQRGQDSSTMTLAGSGGPIPLR